MAKILGGVKFQHFGPPLWPKKCFKQLKKWGRPKIEEKIGWSKTRISLRRRPKKAKIQYGVKPDIFKITPPRSRALCTTMDEGKFDGMQASLMESSKSRETRCSR